MKTTQTSWGASRVALLAVAGFANVAAPGLSHSATPFLPNPAYLSARTQTDGVRHATLPVEAPVDSRSAWVEGADLVNRPVIALTSQTVLGNGSRALAQIEGSMGVLRGRLSTHHEKAFATDGGFVDAVFSVGFEDFIEVTAPGLAAGTPITYVFSLDIEGTSGTTPRPAPPGGLSVGANVSLGAAFLSPTPRLSRIDWALPQGNGVFSQTFDAVVGDLLRIRGTLFAGSQSGTSNGNADAWADFMNTANFTLTPTRADANTLGVSGHDYRVSSVPEPTSISLMIVMGALYVVAAWRGRLPHLDS